MESNTPELGPDYAARAEKLNKRLVEILQNTYMEALKAFVESNFDPEGFEVVFFTEGEHLMGAGTKDSPLVGKAIEDGHADKALHFDAHIEAKREGKYGVRVVSAEVHNAGEEELTIRGGAKGN